MNYHLSGSIWEYANLAPTNLLLYEAALWGCANGCKTLYLGGGVGSGEDSLFKFKKAFYRLEVYIMKKILIISQALPQDYLDLLAEALGKNTKLVVISGSELIGNIKLVKSPRHRPESFRSRLLCWYEHFAFVMKWIRKHKASSFDMVFAISNPPINSWIGLYLKNIYRCPFLYMNWDLYPQVIRESIPNVAAKAICNLWSRWNRKNYPKIDRILTIGDVMAKSMKNDLQCGMNNIEVIPLPVDTDKLKPIAKEANKFVVENDLLGKFIVLYSGKMGKGHNMQIILEAAKKVKKYSDIQFVLIGNGEKRKMVDDFVQKEHLGNVLLYDFQPDSIFPYSMACGDLGIVSQEAALAQLFMPSKTYSMMACGQAIIGICTLDDDLGRLIKEGKIGQIVTDGNPETLERIIIDLYNNREKLKEFQLNSRKLAEELYAKNRIVERYRSLFRDVLQG